MSVRHSNQLTRLVNSDGREIHSDPYYPNDPETIAELVEAIRCGGHHQQAVIEGLQYLWRRGKLRALAELLTDIRQAMLSDLADLLPDLPGMDLQQKPPDHVQAVESKWRYLITMATYGKPGLKSRREIAQAIIDLHQAALEASPNDAEADQQSLGYVGACLQLARMLSAKLGQMSDQQADRFSVSWELASQNRQRWSVKYIDRAAASRVASGRHFDQSARSVDSPRRKGFHRQDIDVGDLFGDMENPARIAAARIDYAEWKSGLPPLYRQVAEMAGSSCTTKEIASKTHMTERRVNQIRSQLEETISKKIPK